MPLRKTAVGFGSVLIAAYLAASGYIGATLTTTSRTPFEHFPDAYGLPYENVRFTSHADRLQLSGWLLGPVHSAAASRPVVIVHGWQQNRQSELDGRVLEVAAHLVGRGRTVLLFDLRGWGRSNGTRVSLGPAEAHDVRGALDFLTERGLAERGVDLIGYAMGAAAALLAAEDDQRVGALVADSSYAELWPLLGANVPSHSGLPPPFTPGAVLAASLLTGADLFSVRPIDAASRLGKRRVPLFVVHGEADSLVPVAHARRIAAAYGQAATTWFVPDAEHLGAYALDPQRYLARVDAFLDDAASATR